MNLFGDAGYYGSAAGAINGAFPSGTYITGISSTPDGKGYWLVGINGSVYTFLWCRHFPVCLNIHLTHLRRWR